MYKRPLGRSGLSVAPLAFGGNVFGWTVDEPAAFRLLDAFVDAGFDLIDTADGYSRWVPGNQGGESETVIGVWLAQGDGRREAVTLATKVGMWERRPGLSRANIVQACEDSLRRLRTDRIDLYQSHRDDPNTPLDETLEAYAQLIGQGKVRAIGASNYEAPRLAEALAVSADKALPRYETLQPLYNLYDRAPFEAALQPLCVREDVGVLPYYALASGFLTGKYRSAADLDQSPRGGTVKKYLDARGHRILAALDAVGAERGATPAQVSLAWLVAQPAVTAAIASATNLAQLQDLIRGVQLALTPQDLDRLDQASA